MIRQNHYQNLTDGHDSEWFSGTNKRWQSPIVRAIVKLANAKTLPFETTSLCAISIVDWKHEERFLFLLKNIIYFDLFLRFHLFYLRVFFTLIIIQLIYIYIPTLKTKQWDKINRNKYKLLVSNFKLLQDHYSKKCFRMFLI